MTGLLLLFFFLTNKLLLLFAGLLFEVHEAENG